MFEKYFSFTEARRFYSVGLPIFIAQISQTGMTFADTAFAGQYSAEHMAAVAVGGSVWMPVALLGIGCLLALSPLSAQLVGSGRPDRAAHLLRQGLWLTVAMSIVLMSFFYVVSLHMDAFGLEPELARISGGFLRAMLWGLPGFLFFVNLRSFLEGFARTRPAMIIGLLGLLVNVPCNYIFIYGKLGMPELGGVGCGVASAISFWFMGLCMLYYLRRDPQYRHLGPLFAPLFRGASASEPRFDGALVLRVLRIGLPGALALFFEVSLFALSAILLAPLGTVMVAGHQIALNFGSLVFMVPLSISMTATIRVGRCLGARQGERAKLVARTALTLSVIFALLIATLTVLCRKGIVAIYTEDAAVAALAGQLLLYQAAYQIVDGLQVTGIGILRGHNDTRIISVICFAAYWIIGLPLGFALARTDLLTPAMGAAGFWVAYIVALGFGAACYLLRVRQLHGLAPEDMLQRVKR
ncbi:MATE family efflux transporter [Desulfovibrio desulfuricans]|uniref:MATE family efflux transporter n=1 Tax=Desulfovibrio desulfuricans TaxID=876 RepID=UPI0035B102D4